MRGALTACVFIALGGLTIDAPPAAARSAEQGLAECRALASRDARTDCYDRLADEVAKAPAQTLPEQTQAAPSAAPPSTAAQSQQPAAPVLQPAAASQTASPQPALPERIGSTLTGVITGDFGGIIMGISEVGTSETGRLRMMTTDGMTWDQSEDYRIHAWPAVGDKVTITKSALGYWCRLSKRDLFHCKPRRKAKPD